MAWLTVAGMIPADAGNAWTAGTLTIEPLSSKDSDWADGTRRAAWPILGVLNLAGTGFETLTMHPLTVPGSDIGESVYPPALRLIAELRDLTGRTRRFVSEGRIAASAPGEWNVNAPLGGVALKGLNSGPNSWLELTVAQLQERSDAAGALLPQMTAKIGEVDTAITAAQATVAGLVADTEQSAAEAEAAATAIYAASGSSAYPSVAAFTDLPDPTGVVVPYLVRDEYRVFAPVAGAWQLTADLSRPPATPPRANPLTRRLPLAVTGSSAPYSTYSADKAALFKTASSSRVEAAGLSGNGTASLTLDAPRLVAIGDSIIKGTTQRNSRLHTTGAYPTQGYDLALENLSGQITYHLERDLGIPVINHGIGSTTLPITLGRADRDLWAVPGASNADSIGANATLSRPADYVMHGSAINDIFTGRTFAQITADYETLVGQCRSRNVPLILWTTSAHQVYADATDVRYLLGLKVNAWLKSKYGLDGKNGVLIFDYAAVINDPATPYKLMAIMVADSIHPNKYGYERINRALYATITKTDFIPTAKNFVLDMAFDMSFTPASFGRATSVRLETDQGEGFDYTLPNAPTHVLSLPRTNAPRKTYTLKLLNSRTPIETGADAAKSYVAVTGVALTDVEATAQPGGGAQLPQTCEIKLASTVTHTTATWNQLYLDTEVYDPADMHTSADSRKITALSPGAYACEAWATWAANATGERALQITHYNAANGAVVSRQVFVAPRASGATVLQWAGPKSWTVSSRDSAQVKGTTSAFPARPGDGLTATFAVWSPQRGSAGRPLACSATSSGVR